MSEKVSRYEILESSIKRLSLLLEAERAAGHSDRKGQPVASLATGITALWAQDTALPPTIVKPYTEFFDGVEVGYDSENYNWVVVDFVPGNDDSDAAPNDAPLRTPRLRVHPVISESYRSRWVTLELTIPDLNLQASEALTIGLLADFHFKDKNEALDTNVVRVVLRADRDGHSEDLDIGFFPVMTVPRLHTLVVKEKRLDLDRVGSAKRYRLLIFLPTDGDWTFSLYHLSVVTT
ncbi:hypothetical protein [Lacimonas salitolerans]|uniref:Uncharacterized protein n=1 Tax=Lacimonas salitolerans TaxID=1323750 RepID=A0ABW4EH02_9RHOB